VKGTILAPLEETEKRSCCKKGEGCINIGPGGKISELIARGKDESREKSYAGRKKSFTDKIGQDHSEGPEKGRREPNGKGSKSLPKKRRKGNKPKEERRFICVCFPIKMHENPIPSLDHLPCNLGITGFVRIPEVPSINIKEIDDETESYEKGDLDPFLRIDFRKPFLHRLSLFEFLMLNHSFLYRNLFAKPDLKLIILTKSSLFLDRLKLQNILSLGQ